MKAVQKRPIKIIFCCLVFFTFKVSELHAQNLKIEGRRDEASISTKMKDGSRSARIIITSALKLTYEDNMGSVTEENIARGEVNNLYSDTLYFFNIDPKNNVRWITVSAAGFAPTDFPNAIKLESQATFVYSVFEPKSVTYEECYQNAVDFFVAGNYIEAYEMFKEAAEKEDRPADSDVDSRIKKAEESMKYLNNAKILFERAEKIREIPNRVISSNTDSVTYFHGLAKRFRDRILENNSADAYCLEYNKRYLEILGKIDRLVFGRVVDNMNQSLGVSNVTIHGKMKYSEILTPLGETDSEGNFRLVIPYQYSQLIFTPNKKLTKYKDPSTQDVDAGKHYKLLIKLSK